MAGGRRGRGGGRRGRGGVQRGRGDGQRGRGDGQTGPGDPQSAVHSLEAILSEIEALYDVADWDGIVDKINLMKERPDIYNNYLIREYEIVALNKLARTKEAANLAVKYVKDNTGDSPVVQTPDSVFKFKEIWLLLGDHYLDASLFMKAFVSYHVKKEDLGDKQWEEIVSKRIQKVVDECAAKGSVNDVNLLAGAMGASGHFHFKMGLEMIDNAVSLKESPLLRWHLQAMMHYLYGNLHDAFIVASKVVRETKAEDLNKGDNDFYTTSCQFVGDGYFELAEYDLSSTWYAKAEKAADREEDREKYSKKYARALELQKEEEEYLKTGNVKRGHLPSIGSQRRRKCGNPYESLFNLDTDDGNEVTDKSDDKEVSDQNGLEGADEFVPFKVEGDPVTLCFEERVSDRVYNGCITTNSGDFPKSFVVATPDQIRKFKDLDFLRAGNEGSFVDCEFLVKVDAIGSQVIVCERVLPLMSFFNEKRKAFMEGHRTDRRSWWKLIAENYRGIIGDALLGLRLMLRKGRCCGDVMNSVYVTETGRGKLLPTLSPAEPGDVLCSLKAAMQYVLDLPFKKVKSIPFLDRHKSTNLPEELIAFFKLAHVRILDFVPLEWVLDHPYFWDATQRYEFVDKLYELMKRHFFCKKRLNQMMASRKIYGNSTTGTWMSRVQHGALLAVLNKPKKKYSGIAKYMLPADIVRFMNAAFDHVNEDEYDGDRAHVAGLTVKEGKATKYARAQTEAPLREHFPEVYSELYFSLLLTGIEMLKELPKEEVHEAFIILTRKL